MTEVSEGETGHSKVVVNDWKSVEVHRHKVHKTNWDPRKKVVEAAAVDAQGNLNQELELVEMKGR